MNKSVYSYYCVIFPGKFCASAFDLTFLVWLWYMDAGQHRGASSSNGPICWNIQTWWGFIKLLLLVFRGWLQKLTDFAWTDLLWVVSAMLASFTHLFGCAYVPHKRIENSFLWLFGNSGLFFPVRLPPSITCQPLPYCESNVKPLE